MLLTACGSSPKLVGQNLRLGHVRNDCALQMRCLTDIPLHIHTLWFRNSLALRTLGVYQLYLIHSMWWYVRISIATYCKPISSAVLDHIRTTGGESLLSTGCSLQLALA